MCIFFVGLYYELNISMFWNFDIGNEGNGSNLFLKKYHTASLPVGLFSK